MSIGDFPECLSQRILVGIILAGRLGVGEGFAVLAQTELAKSSLRTLEIGSTYTCIGVPQVHVDLFLCEPNDRQIDRRMEEQDKKTII